MSRAAAMGRATAPPRGMGPGGSTAAGGVADYRLDKVQAHRPLRGRWLDCGSCDGEYTATLRQRGASTVVGVEVDPVRAAAARTRWADRLDVFFVAAAAEALPFPDNCFEGALLNEVLEHVADEEGCLGELGRVLDPGALLAVFSPNRWFPFEGHGMSAGRFSVGFPVPVLPWLPERLATKVMQARNYWPGELAALVAGAGLRVVTVDFAMPLFSHYRWLPDRVIAAYRNRLAKLEDSRWLRRFGVSTLILAHKP